MSGGLTGPGAFSTAFTPASAFTPGLPFLRSTIQDTDPDTLDQIAATWTSVHEALRGAQEELKAHVQAATDHWTGAAADAFAARGNELHQSLGNGADYATNASTGVTHAAAALRTAKQDMPQVPGPLEGISPLSRPAVVIPLAPATGSTTGLTFNGAHEALVQQRQQEAETVLQRLGFQYESAATMIGTPINLPYHDDKGVYPPPCMRPLRIQRKAPLHLRATRPSLRQPRVRPVLASPASVPPQAQARSLQSTIHLRGESPRPQSSMGAARPTERARDQALLAEDPEKAGVVRVPRGQSLHRFWENLATAQETKVEPGLPPVKAGRASLP